MSPALRRKLFFAALYFSEGAPIGWLWWTLPTQLRRAGVDVTDVTALTATLALPWALKFLWAPLVDVLRTRWFGLRSWLVCAQLGMAATLVPMLWLDPVANWQAAFWLLVGHAFCAATQDVAIDAMAIRAVPARERGALNGAMQVGMIGGRVLFSWGVLKLAATTGERLAVPMLLGVLGCTIALAAIAAPAVREPARVVDPAARARLRRHRGRYLRALLRSRRLPLLAGFALLGGAGFEAAGALAGTWLADRGLTDAEVADFRLISAGLLAAGALLGGHRADRRGSGPTAGIWLGVVALTVAATAFCDDLGARGAALTALTATYFGIGAFTASSYALFMQNASGPFAATVFSAFMGMTNACEAWAGRLGGVMQEARGYPFAMLMLALLSLPALLLLNALRPRGARAGGDRDAAA